MSQASQPASDDASLLNLIEEQEEAVPAAERPAAGARGPAPANWVEMAQEADTESARVWWTRKVATWYSDNTKAA